MSEERTLEGKERIKGFFLPVGLTGGLFTQCTRKSHCPFLKVSLKSQGCTGKQRLLKWGAQPGRGETYQNFRRVLSSECPLLSTISERCSYDNSHRSDGVCGPLLEDGLEWGTQTGETEAKCGPGQSGQLMKL